MRSVRRAVPGAAVVVGLALTAACGTGSAGTVTAGAVSSAPAAASATATPPGPSVTATPSAAPSVAPAAPAPSGTPSASASPKRTTSAPARRTTRWNEPTTFQALPVVRGRALAGMVVVLDPGHQIGNSRHLAKVNRLVDAGNGIRKACNTTGTQTNGGYPESKVAMRIALAAKKRLEAQGAKVVLTRPREDVALWGPCIDARGRVGNGVDADAVVSIHADGAPATARGFHVIRPASVKGWTDDIAKPSKRLAIAVHDALVDAGQRPATYIGSHDGYDVRSDLGTLNWSDQPIVMIELGNMRSARDAAMLTDPTWQDGVAAAAITAGVVDFLG
ncbi:MAG: N-acetylmuramoyl-L-alanine amidase [Actinobacteria bacterium]|nr:N-acetylmuramoyl-L-alanine amidase [Actinomycetota bacterium]